MSSKGSLHLTRTPDGIWYYQRWMPVRFRQANPSLRTVFRVSMRTRSNRKAMRLSRILTLKIDRLAHDHFDNTEAFGKAMELLLRSTKLQLSNVNFDDYDDLFLSNLDEYDEWLLTKAERFNQCIETEFKALRHEVVALKKALAEGGSSEDLIAKITEAINPKLPDEMNPTLDELHKLWNEKNTHLKSYESTSRAIELFIRFVSDFEQGIVRVNQLSTEHIHYYQKYYPKIPVRIIALDHTIPELVKLTGKPKSPKTITDNFSTISSFLNWIAKKGFPIDGSLQKVLTQGSDIKRDPRLAKGRKPFSDQDLQKLFNSREYLETGKFATSGMYWVPLLALFTGARVAELLQLEKHDILKLDKIWVFNIDDIDPETKDEFKHVKQDGSRRKVPIHKQLIDLGFIDFVEKQKNRLFPDEPRTKKGKFANFSKRFRTYRINKEVEKSHDMELKDFHSFRHTVETRLADLRYSGSKNSQFDQGIIDGIIGHASTKRSMGETTYTHSQFLERKHSAINSIKYPKINFSNFVSWEKCSFSRKPYRERVVNKLKVAADRG